MSSPSADKPEAVTVPSADATSEGLDGLSCEWCDKPARLKIPKMKKIRGKKVGLVSTGMHILCCYNHERIAREIAQNDG